MNDTLSVCLLYTRDAEVAARLRGCLALDAGVRVAADAADLLDLCERYAPVFAWVDLVMPDAGRVLQRLREERPDCVAVALGLPGSDAIREADRAGAWAVEDRLAAPDRLMTVWRQGMKHVELLLRRRPGEADTAGAEARPPSASRAPGAEPLALFARAVRHLDSVDGVLDHLTDVILSVVPLARVGVFVEESGGYRLRAGRGCLDDTRYLLVERDAFAVNWLRRNACPISRLSLRHVEDPAMAARLRQTLNTMGAEALVPLHGASRMIGWLVAGRRLTGAPLTEEDLAGLVRAAESVATALETAMLHEEIALQKTMAEALLESMPLGIVAVDDKETVRWCNATAARLLGASSASSRDVAAIKLTGRWADLLLRAANGEGGARQMAEWDDPITRVPLRGEAWRVESGGRRVGAMLTLRDLREDRALQEKKDRVERARFWTELAAAISHEVKNPLVAIRTLAQLLPERYGDPEFRSQFATLALQEVDRLNAMVEQINAFANPRDPVFEPLQVGAVLRDALEEARRRVASNGIHVEWTADERVPDVRGDRRALVDAFAHLFANSFEILQDAGDPRLRIAAVAGVSGAAVRPSVTIRVEDNGHGIPPNLRADVYSPFCTRKARGIGLGLPIVKRTVLDHGGDIAIETGDKGTAVTVTLPAEPDGAVPS